MKKNKIKINMEKGLEGTLWSLSCLKEYSQKWSEKQAGRKTGFAQIKLAPCKYKCGIYILIYYSYLRIATYLRIYLGANLCESIFFVQWKGVEFSIHVEHYPKTNLIEFSQNQTGCPQGKPHHRLTRLRWWRKLFCHPNSCQEQYNMYH